VYSRLGDKSFEIDVTPAARQLLLDKGASAQYGARELKRTIHRLLTQPLAAQVAAGRIAPGTRVVANVDGEVLAITPLDEPAAAIPERRASPLVLALDDHVPLLEWLGKVLEAAGMTPIKVGTAEEARDAVASQGPDAALLDVMLPDGDGVSLALEFRKSRPQMQLILMTGMELSDDEAALCERYDIPVLRKPFLGEDAVNLLRARLVHAPAAKTSNP
jgi:CheY-like chemotaxis protein